VRWVKSVKFHPVLLTGSPFSPSPTPPVTSRELGGAEGGPKGNNAISLTLPTPPIPGRHALGPAGDGVFDL
jgi:hypothetical protein